MCHALVVGYWTHCQVDMVIYKFMNTQTPLIHSLLTASKRHDSKKQAYTVETRLLLLLSQQILSTKNYVLFPKKATLDWHESVWCCTEGPRRVSALHYLVYTPAQLPTRHDLYLLTGARIIPVQSGLILRTLAEAKLRPNIPTFILGLNSFPSRCAKQKLTEEKIYCRKF